MKKNDKKDDELKNWVSELSANSIDDILEWLSTEDMFNNKGKLFRHNFWERNIKNKPRIHGRLVNFIPFFRTKK